MLIEATGLSLSFGEERLWRNLDFSIAAEQRVAVSGPSGSGKSSLLRLILGFESPDAGSIFYNGRAAMPPDILAFRKRCAYLPQQLIFPFLKVQELLDYMGELNEGTKKSSSAHFQKMLPRLGLETDFQTRDLASLSGGQKQRLLLAMVMSRRKEVLLLDEPSSALDLSNSDKARALVLEEYEGTVIYTSHDQNWIDAADQIIEL